MRDKVVISTKGGICKDGTIDNSFEKLLSDVVESKKALNTDYIDIFYLHKDDKKIPVDDLVEQLWAIKESENINMLGFSNMASDRFILAYDYSKKKDYDLKVFAQCWWSLAEYTSSMWDDENTTHMDDVLYSFLCANKLFAMGYTSQCKGYFQKYVNDKSTISDFLKYRIETERNIIKAECIKEYCYENKISPTAVVNGYITSNKLEGVALVNCNSINQLNEVLTNCDYVLDKEFIEKLDAI